MKSSNGKRAFKGGIGMAAAVVLAWVVGEVGGVEMPDMVVAALGSLIGSLVAYVRED